MYFKNPCKRCDGYGKITKFKYFIIPYEVVCPRCEGKCHENVGPRPNIVPIKPWPKVKSRGN